jgi:YbbR domain-containing protein
MQRSIIENLGLGALALILGFLVWIGATFQDNPPTTEAFAEPIPIEIINRPQGWLVRKQSAESVRVQVRGRQDSLDRLTQNSFRATVDLAGLETGLHEVPVDVQVSDRSVTIIQQDPPSISLTLDRQQEKELPVEVRVNDPDSIPMGYTSRPPEVEPKTVRVSGPESLVDQVNRATVSIWLQGAKSTVEKDQAVRLLDAEGDTVEGLKPDPLLVTVRVPIDQELGFRDVTVRAVITGTPASGYWVSNILVQPSTLTVFGLPSTLDNIGGFLETVPIDISDAKSDLVKKVPLDLPRGISVLSEEAQQGVQVEVQISAIVGGQTIQRQIEKQGLSLGLKATISPEMVDVILSGPLPVLQDLSPEDVKVVVDLFGLTVGTHKVTPEAVLVPEGLEVVNIVPDTVEVNIQLGP